MATNSTVAIVLGYPASGKSTVAEQFVKNGFARLNRDTEGGKVSSLIPKLEALLSDRKNVVLDNLFATVDIRKPFIDAAVRSGAQVECHWVTTSIEDSTYNACQRMVEHYGHILSPDEIKKSKSPNTFPPAVLFHFRKEFEKPSTDEGFSKVIEVPFVRNKRGKDYCVKGLILDYDDTLRHNPQGDRPYPVTKDEVQILPRRAATLKKFQDQGYLLMGVSNQSGIAKGELTHDVADQLFKHTNSKLGFDIDYRFCPHRVPPMTCYCRKPMPGYGVELTMKHKLDAENTIMVGDLKTDETFAKRSGFQFEYADEFFK